MSPSSFLSFFSWTSFIGEQGSGPFQVGNDSHFCGRAGIRFFNSFGLANPHYRTRPFHDYLDLPFPSRWMDVLVGVHFSTSWTRGWLEVSWKWAAESITAFRAIRFPVRGHPMRCHTRTIGDTSGDNRFGPYSGAPMEVQVALAAFFVAPTRHAVIGAFDAIRAGD